MKTMILILLMTLITGCGTSNPLVKYNPYRFDQPTMVHGGNTMPSPRATTIVTPQGNYVVIPNYSSGGVQAIITPGR